MNFPNLKSEIRNPISEIPTANGPAGLTILKGLARDRSLLTAMEAMHDELGTFFQITMPRFQPVVVSGPELNRQVLVTERDKFSWRAFYSASSCSCRQDKKFGRIWARRWSRGRV